MKWMEVSEMEMPDSIRKILEASGISKPTTYPTEEEQAKASAEQANRERGDLKGIDCPDCLNRGYITVVDGTHTSVQICHCMKARESLRLIRLSGLKEMLDQYTLQNWQTPEPWQRKAKELAMKYVEEKTGWFFVAGQSGCGKSHLCTAICGEFLKAGIDVRYMLWRDAAVQAKAIVNTSEYEDVMEPLKNATVLYIDDLFKTGRGQQPTTADVNLAFELINFRYMQKGKLTLISTERGFEALMDIDEAIGGRIYERSKGYRLDFRNKPNWRLRE